MKKSTLSGITAVLLAGALAAGVCSAGYASRDAAGKWFKNPDISTWHWSDKFENHIYDDDYIGGVIATPDSGNNGVEVSARKLSRAEFEDYGISAQAESAYTLTATLSPTSADDKRVEWTVTCADSSVNVSDYIGLSANGLKATVTCKQAFDKQFTVTVKSLDNPEAKATCTLDYVERITGITVTMPKLTSNTATVTCTTQSSKYTVKSINSVRLNNFQFNGNFKDRLESALSTSYDWYHPAHTSELVNYTSNGMAFINGNRFADRNHDAHFDNLIGCFFACSSQFLDMDGLDEGDVVYSFRNTCSETYIGTVDVTVSSTYSGVTYSSIKETVEIWIDGASLHIPVKGITLDNSNILF